MSKVYRTEKDMVIEHMRAGGRMNPVYYKRKKDSVIPLSQGDAGPISPVCFDKLLQWEKVKIGGKTYYQGRLTLTN